MKTKQAISSLLIISCGVFAQEKSEKGTSIWNRETLSGDWWEGRSSLFEKGYEFTFEYTAEAISNISGGIKTGSVYNGLGYSAVDIDGETALGWVGTSIRFSALWTHGASPAQHIGDELTVSNIDAYDSLRLYEVYIEKDFGKLNLRMGNLLADEEFVGAVYGGPLFSAVFGQPAFWSANTLNTGPAFNVPGLGLRLRYNFNEATYFQAGIYDGDTFDDTSGNPSINQHGTHFTLGNGQGWTSLYEIGCNGFNMVEDAGLPGWYRAGAWYHSTEFDKHDGSKGEGNGGIYAAIDQMVVREDEDQGLGIFSRLGVGERDRSRFHWVLDTGLSYTGLFSSRDEDVATLGFAYGKHSSEITTVKSHESVLELTYNYQLSPTFYIQPDIQWINHPSGDDTVGDGWAIGLRVGLAF